TTGEPSGFQLPTAAMEKVNSVRFLAHVNSEYMGEPVAFVISVRTNDNVLMRVRREPPPVIPPTFLECRQPDLVDRVEISFLNHGPYDVIQVERDGAVIATLAGTATGYTDNDVAPGVHRYRIRATQGGLDAEPRECEVRVGVGALLRRSIIIQSFSPYQMTRDPSDGSFWVSVNSPQGTPDFYHYDSDLQFIEIIPSPVDPPWQTAALAVRPTPQGSEIWSISWEVRAPWLQKQDFFLSVQDTTGAFIMPSTPFVIPGPLVGESLTYPCAMAYDEGSDSFWFLERNTDTFWQMNTDGTLINSILHPLPPLQPFVFNLGLAVDSVRNTLTATTAAADDQKITRTVGITETGIPTGELVRLDDAKMNPIYGMARGDHKIWVCGSIGSIPLIAEIKASDAVAPPENLECTEIAPNEVSLTWTESVAYDELVLKRGGVEIAIVPSSQESYLDTGVGNGTRVYTLAGRVSSEQSAPSVCSLVVTGNTATFVRGDANGDEIVNIADPIYVLEYLFADGRDPTCFDAADGNDDGAVQISDAIYLLTFLFDEGLPPPPPFPDPGGDPTGDGLLCD
ncbi:MAG: dockerin type I repeat-containing protein, partial [Planctomycetota bacterium]